MSEMRLAIVMVNRSLDAAKAIVAGKIVRLIASVNIVVAIAPSETCSANV